MIVPVTRCACFAHFQVSVAFGAALDAACGVEDAPLGPALVDEVILALVTPEDTAI